MDNYIKSLKMQMLQLRKQIDRENKELQQTSLSIIDDTSEFDIKSSIDFMKGSMNHLVEASTKLEQLQEVYISLMYVQGHQKLSNISKNKK